MGSTYPFTTFRRGLASRALALTRGEAPSQLEQPTSDQVEVIPGGLP
jgi:hypothetical protein